MMSSPLGREGRRLYARLFMLALLVGLTSTSALAASGDYNGDGFADLAIGVPRESVGTVDDAGAVHVLYGSSSALTTSGAQFWHQNTSGVADAAEPFDRFGSALASGDFNNDGFDDLAVGVPREALAGFSSAGAVHVLYGGASGLSASGSQFWHQNSLGMPGAIEAGDNFGLALTAGDYDADGFDDLVIGVPGDAVSGVRAGAINVLYGSASRLTSSGAQLWHQDSPRFAETAEEGDGFASTLTTGNFNGDLHDDLVIAVIRESVGTIVRAGAVHVLYGSTAGVSIVGQQYWHQNVSGVAGNSEADDQFGAALAAGDFNNDNFDELAIGVPADRIVDLRTGALHVLYGTQVRLQTTNIQYWHQNVSAFPETAEAGDRFADALASGDFNGDQRDDLAIGVPGESIGTILRAGAVHVLYGSDTRLTVRGTQFFHQDVAGFDGLAQTDDGFGASLAAGRYNGDFGFDLVIGVPLDHVGTTTDAGALHVLVSTGGALQPTQYWHQNSSGVAETAETGDDFAGALN
jgi:disulfide bond formation protein DsbB